MGMYMAMCACLCVIEMLQIIYYIIRRTEFMENDSNLY